MRHTGTNITMNTNMSTIMNMGITITTMKKGTAA